MNQSTINAIREYEKRLGFPVRRRCITLEMNEPHDESFAYPLCVKYYGNNQAIASLIAQGNSIIRMLLAEYRNSPQDSTIQSLEHFYSLVGNFNFCSVMVSV